MPHYLPVDYDPYDPVQVAQRLKQMGYRTPHDLAPLGIQDHSKDLEAAKNALYGMTGIPDLQEAWQAYKRGEILPAIGQGAYGAANLATLALPAAKALQPGLRAIPSMLKDVGGAVDYAKKFHNLSDIASSGDNYVYHATSLDRLQDIAEAKKLSTFKPSYGTDQREWPDGSTQKRNYWGNSPQHVDPFVPDQPPAIIRAPKDVVNPQKERYTNDLYSTKPVPADKFEYWNGEEWRNLLADHKNDLTPKPEPTNALQSNEAQLKNQLAPQQQTIKAYHYSPNSFDKFDPTMVGNSTDPGLMGRALYFSTDPKVAEGGPFSYEVNLNLKNPLNLEHAPDWRTSTKSDLISDALGIQPPVKGALTVGKNSPTRPQWQEWSDAIANAAQEKGHDAAVLNYSPAGYPHQEIAVYDPETIDILRKYMKDPIKAYHGSPHDFDAFDLSKIGTGEGAQAYGHGLYFAENEGVAKSYREALTNNGVEKYVNDAPYDSSNPEHLAASLVQTFNKSGDGRKIALSELQHDIANPELDDAKKQIYQQAANLIFSNNELPSVVSRPTGRMYEVNLHADPDTFLHWDKPLSEQPKPVLQSLAKHGFDDPNSLYKVSEDESGYNKVDYVDSNGEWQTSPRLFKSPEEAKNAAMSTINMMGKNPTGGQIVESQKLVPGDVNDKAMATEALRNAGISGIKYADQGSRNFDYIKQLEQEIKDQSAGLSDDPYGLIQRSIDSKQQNIQRLKDEQTHNYVVFDPKMIEIVKKYGLAPLIAGGAMTLSDDPANAQHLIPVDHDPFIEPPPADGYTTMEPPAPAPTPQAPQRPWSSPPSPDDFIEPPPK